MPGLRSEGHCKDAFQDGKDGKADRGERGNRTSFSSTRLLTAVNAGVSGDEGGKVDWSSSLGFAVDFNMVQISLTPGVKDHLEDNGAQRMTNAIGISHM